MGQCVSSWSSKLTTNDLGVRDGNKPQYADKIQQVTAGLNGNFISFASDRYHDFLCLDSTGTLYIFG